MTDQPDFSNMLNALHVPADAGACAEDLEKILKKIPDGWGRWIDCGAGWYPLIIKLDQDLEALAPGYQVHQVKEKFGGLRYYYSLPEMIDPYTQAHPAPEDVDSHQWKSWEEGYQEWLDSSEGKAYQSERERLDEAAQELVAVAEAASFKICEHCGAPGRPSRGPWISTRCEDCRKHQADQW